MSTKSTDASNDSRIDITNQLGEDPFREPCEKESVWHLMGDETHFEVTSFKKSLYKDLIKYPHFELERLHVLSIDGRETTVESYEEVANDPELRVIGVTGNIPVGGMSIGVPRKSNSPAQVVK